jgi:hypothetical protein
MDAPLAGEPWFYRKKESRSTLALRHGKYE